MKSEFVTVPGGRRWEVFIGGEGAPLLWLHGLRGVDLDDPVLAALQKNHRVIAPVAPSAFGISVGMFGTIGATGRVSNLTITNASVTAHPNVTHGSRLRSAQRPSGIARKSGRIANAAVTSPISPAPAPTPSRRYEVIGRAM